MSGHNNVEHLHDPGASRHIENIPGRQEGSFNLDPRYGNNLELLEESIEAIHIELLRATESELMVVVTDHPQLDQNLVDIYRNEGDIVVRNTPGSQMITIEDSISDKDKKPKEGEAPIVEDQRDEAPSEAAEEKREPGVYEVARFGIGVTPIKYGVISNYDFRIRVFTQTIGGKRITTIFGDREVIEEWYEGLLVDKINARVGEEDLFSEFGDLSDAETSIFTGLDEAAEFVMEPFSEEEILYVLSGDTDEVIHSARCDGASVHRIVRTDPFEDIKGAVGGVAEDLWVSIPIGNRGNEYYKFRSITYYTQIKGFGARDFVGVTPPDFEISHVVLEDGVPRVTEFTIVNLDPLTLVLSDDMGSFLKDENSVHTLTGICLDIPAFKGYDEMIKGCLVNDLKKGNST